EHELPQVGTPATPLARFVGHRSRNASTRHGPLPSQTPRLRTGAARRRGPEEGVAVAQVELAGAVAAGIDLVQRVAAEPVPEQRGAGQLSHLKPRTAVAVEDVAVRAGRRALEQHPASEAVAGE